MSQKQNHKIALIYKRSTRIERTREVSSVGIKAAEGDKSMICSLLYNVRVYVIYYVRSAFFAKRYSVISSNLFFNAFYPILSLFMGLLPPIANNFLPFDKESECLGLVPLFSSGVKNFEGFYERQRAIFYFLHLLSNLPP